MRFSGPMGRDARKKLSEETKQRVKTLWPEGLSRQIIAERLSISPYTVDKMRHG